jgi:spermidine/putrescine transport system substrate-binding protein
MIRISMYSLIARSLFILFWLMAIFLFLHMPYFFSHFYYKRSLTIFTWPRILDANYLRKFEAKTGITLYINYYESNEELMSKLEATGGRDCDIVIPTDYAVAWMIERRLLKKIDKNRLTFFNRIRPQLLHHYYDPENEYSLPYYWIIYGLGINTRYFNNKQPSPTWDLLFNESLLPDPIGMTNYFREAILITALNLFGSIDALKDNENLQKVQEALLKQKDHVAAYNDEMAEELLLSDTVPVAVAQSADIFRIAKDNPHIGFIIPREGSFLDIESIVIPAATENDDLIYMFLNYLYRPDVIEHHVEQYSFCPPTIDVESNEFKALCISDDTFNKLMFFKDIVSPQKMNDIWIAVMAK